MKLIQHYIYCNKDYHIKEQCEIKFFLFKAKAKEAQKA